MIQIANNLIAQERKSEAPATHAAPAGGFLMRRTAAARMAAA